MWMLMFILYPCLGVFASQLWRQSPSLCPTGSTVLFCSVPSSSVQAFTQMTGSLSQGTATSAGEYLHVSQPVSICHHFVFFSCSLFVFCSTRCVLFSHCTVDEGKVSYERRRTNVFLLLCFCSITGVIKLIGD